MPLLLPSLLSVGMILGLVCSLSAAHAEAIVFQSAKMWPNAETINILGTLSRPKGKGPFPAIVLIPNCGGPTQYEFAKFWPKYLNKLGYITLNVDHFGPRKQRRCTKRFIPKPHVVIQDAYGAYAYLARLPDVDAKRVGILGSSLGAHAINWYTGKGKKSPEGHKFRAAISLYPSGCKAVSPTDYMTPTMIIMGDKERGVSSCRRLPKNPKLSVNILPDTYHAFDQPTATRKKNGQMRKDIVGNTMFYSKAATRKAQSLVKEFFSVHLTAGLETIKFDHSENSRLENVGGKDPYKAVGRRDTDSDGKVSQAEWGRSLAVFSRIDADDDGFLTPEEFHAHWKKLQ